MCRFLPAAFCGLVTLLADMAASGQEQPRIGYVYPAGAQQGATLKITLGGRYLNRVDHVHVSGSGIQAEVVKEDDTLTEMENNNLRTKIETLLRGKPDATTLKQVAEMKRRMSRYQIARQIRMKYPAIGETLVVRVKVAADAAPGRREIRVESPQGFSPPARFYVGTLPEFYRAEPEVVVHPRDDRGPTYPAAVTPDITLPAVVNGQILPREPDLLYYSPERFTPGSADRYRFQARKGQRLVITAAARELIPYLADAVPGWFQATLAVYDAHGKELAYDDDYQFHPDPVLLFQVPEDGAYVVEIKDAIYRGRPDFVYRITLGELPFITGMFPLGGPAGTPATVHLAGWNLPSATLTLDTPSAPGVIPVTVRQGKLISNALPFVVDNLPELREQEPNDDPQAAQAVSLPAIVNGRIDRPGDWDVFRFRGRAGQPVVAEVYARRLESPLDSVLELLDAAGRRVVFNDDHEDKGDGLRTHHADSFLQCTLPADGTYYVRLGDAQHHGGPEYGYRLRLSAPRPDFELRVSPSYLNASTWRLNPLAVLAVRRDGFTGPIELRIAEGSERFALSGNVLPEGQDQIRMTLAMMPMLGREPLPLRLEGRATIDGKEVVHQAIPADEMMQAFFYKHLVPADAGYLVPEDRVRYHEQDAGWVKRQIREHRPFQSSLAITSPQPVKIPLGGTVEVRFRAQWDPRGELHIELSDPPEGITVQRVSRLEKGLAVVLRGDPAKAQPGLRGNLMANAYSQYQVTDKDGKTRDARNQQGALPAIPFEIVKP